MVAKLNHTIVVARDKEKSALFLSEIMGLEPPLLLSHFALVTVGDQLTLDYVRQTGRSPPSTMPSLSTKTSSMKSSEG